jgi:hypothetical protein
MSDKMAYDIVKTVFDKNDSSRSTRMYNRTRESGVVVALAVPPWGQKYFEEHGIKVK